MNKDQAISKLVRKLFRTQRRLFDAEQAMGCIQNILHGIGGPLNDNRLGYTAEQKSELLRISAAIDGALQ